MGEQMLEWYDEVLAFYLCNKVPCETHCSKPKGIVNPSASIKLHKLEEKNAYKGDVHVSDGNARLQWIPIIHRSQMRSTW
jgi:hypothetical protein